MCLKGKSAVITGAANGIGRAAALAFAKAGTKLLLVDRDLAGEETAALIRRQSGQAQFIQADVSRAGDVQQYVDTALSLYGRIDSFFNNAGIEGKRANLAAYDETDFDAIMAVNVKGVFLGLRYVLPMMLEQRSGSIVNTASTAGLKGAPGLGPYSASKHAVLGLTRSAALEAAPHGVRVNAVCPGPVETRMMRSLEAQAAPEDPEGVYRKAKGDIPSGRYSTAEEVADSVLFLCSDRARHIIGIQLPIDGGRTA